ncbi:type II secretion system protein D (GspD) [Mucilaginibacter frigoritolerans]|uniref:Type II secretion system protein D (GspD) n=1 Tax=Mucilaginibacter frigoritolerans TaxID=652788 RepID=A0A562TZH7_9SPHI|nr:secretin and TonB N-terminal domain-containing protein [Mucilaginibacter frigoritolerans]TWI98628.1 type II secretion system protein D (GspD) [Mucilaginibacter frigoritolerans]
MIKKFTRLLLICFCLACSFSALAQQTPRIRTIQKKLDSLAKVLPGLDQKVSLQINGSVQQYLQGIAAANNLSISVDPKLSFPINDNLNDVTASNILLFLAQKYSLDISTVGSIIYITSYQEPVINIKPPVKEIDAVYNRSNNSLSLTLNNDSLTSVAKKITQVSGKNVIVPVALQGKKVNAFIAAAPFETAMDKLAYANEIKMVKTADDYYLFQPLAENEELYVNGDNQTAVRKLFKQVSPAPGGNAASGVFFKTVNGQKLISADANNAPILNLISQASQELNYNYSIYSEIKGTINIHVSDVSYEEFLGLLLKGTDYTFQSENGIYLIGDKKLEGLRSFKAIHLQNRSIDTVVSMIPADWKKGVEIKEFREQNTILLSGSSAQIREIESVIKQLDELVPVVLIEVTIIDFTKTRTIATGISAGVSDSVKTGGTILSGINFTASASGVNSFLNSLGSLTSLNLGHVVPNFYVTLQASETNNNVNVRSVPKLTALNGHTATLSIGSKLYYKNSTQNLIPSASTNTSVFTNTYVPVEANLSVDIKPIVSGDDEVTLGIKVNISDFTSIPTDGSPPPQSISKFESSLRVHSEDTVLLGGMERTENDLSASGVPILSRIPILKWIFSSRTKTNSKVVTVLFIKPTILR